MRDVSRILSDADLVKLKAFLNATPASPVDPHAFAEYPKMLFHPDWLTCYKLIQSATDPLVRKEAVEKIRLTQIIVNDFETEEEYLADGWKTDPCDLIIADNEANGVTHPNPREPKGREYRRAKSQQEADRQAELREIKRRYALLTGKKLDEDADAPMDPPTAAPVDAYETPVAPPPRTRPARRAAAPAGSKVDRVRQAAARSARA